MSTDLFKQGLWNDGEGLVHDDLNDAQRFMQAITNDQMLQYLIQGAAKETLINASDGLIDPQMAQQASNNADTRWAYCLSPGAAFLKLGSANNKIAISGGTLLQKIGNTTGDAPSLLAYTFTGAEEFTLTNGDATNPRIDIFQMKLEYVTGDPQTRDMEDAATRIVTTTSFNKKRRVQCTLSVKAGTPHATLPTIPTPDAGYCMVGHAVVGNGWTTAGNAPIFGVDTTATNNVVISDQRMPLRVRAYRVDPSQFKLVTAWASSNNGSTVTSSNATNLLYVPCPAGLGRIVGVSFHLTGSLPTPTGTAFDLGWSNGIISSSYVARNICVLQGFATHYMTPHFSLMQHFNNNVGGSPGPGLTPATSGINIFGAPLWTNGLRCPKESQRLSATIAPTPDTAVVRLQSGANGTVLGAVTFYVAEGL